MNQKDLEHTNYPYNLGRLFLYQAACFSSVRDNHILIGKISSVYEDGFGMMFWKHDQHKWGSIYEASTIPTFFNPVTV